MSLILMAIVFVNLSIVLGVVILVLPRRWQQFNFLADPSPYISAFGIFCIVTALEVHNLLSYWNLVVIFTASFPCIFLAYQFKEMIEDERTRSITEESAT